MSEYGTATHPGWRALIKELKQQGRELRRQGLLAIFSKFLNRLSSPLRLGWFWLMEFDGIPPPRSRVAQLRLIVRPAAGCDIPALIQCQRRNRAAALTKRFADGDHCAVVLSGGRVVGYGWFSVRPTHLEGRYLYRIPIPPDAIYAYDYYILPQYRIKGAWLLVQGYMAELMKTLGRSRVIALIDHGNEISMKSHLRFGFRRVCKVRALRVWGKSYAHVSTEPEISPTQEQKPTGVSRGVSL
jgi:L-amino acid N-acyltransferase YncA